jgi:hypothetical protein
MEFERILIRKIQNARMRSNSTNGNISNMAMNELTVLNLMNQHFFDDCYDDETDFQQAYNNCVEEIVEAEAGRNFKPPHIAFVFR